MNKPPDFPDCRQGRHSNLPDSVRNHSPKKNLERRLIKLIQPDMKRLFALAVFVALPVRDERSIADVQLWQNPFPIA
jgi:hypothetical protein